VIQPPRGPALSAVIGDGKDRYLVGRSDGLTQTSVDLPIEDRTASRRHCELLKAHTPTGWMLRDLHSTNGTVVDGRRVDPDRPADLNHGSEVRIGDTLISVGLGRAPEGRPDPAAAPPRDLRTVMIPFGDGAAEAVARVALGGGAALPLPPLPPLPMAPAAPDPGRMLLVCQVDDAAATMTGIQGPLAQLNQIRLGEGDEVTIAVRNGALVVRTGATVPRR